MKKKLFLISNQKLTFNKFLVSLCSLILIGAALGFNLINYHNISQGVYFTGDTISYLEATEQGFFLSIFIKHAAEWPPFLSFILYTLKQLPTSIAQQFKIFDLLCLTTTQIFLYILLHRLIQTPSKEKKFLTIILSIIISLGGIHRLLFQVALSEPLFLSLLILTLLSFLNFLQNPTEFKLSQLMLVNALLPFTRYLGIINWLVTNIFASIIVIKQKPLNKKISFLFFVFSVCLSFLPTAFYLYSNKLKIGMFLPAQDLLSKPTPYLTLISHSFTQTLTDLNLFLVVAFLLGLLLTFRYDKLLLALTLSQSLLYLTYLSYNFHRYQHFDSFPSRYQAVSYPLLLLAVCLFASLLKKFIQKKLLKNKITMIKKSALLMRINKNHLLSSIYLFTTGVLINSTLQAYKFQKQELNSQFSLINEAEYSTDLVQYCNKYNQTGKLFLHPFTRNFLGASLKYLCSKKLNNIWGQNLTLTTDDYVLSAHQLKLDDLSLIDTFIGRNGNKKIYVYQINSSTYRWDPNLTQIDITPLTDL